MRFELSRAESHYELVKDFMGRRYHDEHDVDNIPKIEGVHFFAQPVSLCRPLHTACFQFSAQTDECYKAVMHLFALYPYAFRNVSKRIGDAIKGKNLDWLSVSDDCIGYVVRKGEKISPVFSVVQPPLITSGYQHVRFICLGDGGADPVKPGSFEDFSENIASFTNFVAAIVNAISYNARTRSDRERIKELGSLTVGFDFL